MKRFVKCSSVLRRTKLPQISQRLGGIYDTCVSDQCVHLPSADWCQIDPKFCAIIGLRELWAGPFSQESCRRLMNNGDITYTTTWSRVQVAADQGCGLCKLLITDKENHKDQVSFQLNFGAVRPEPDLQLVTPLHVQYLIVEVEGYEIHISNNSYYLHTSPDDPAATEIVARDLIRDVRSQRAYSLALECLQECVANHKSCPKPNDSARLPTRVIDCLDPEHPKIMVSNGMHAAYAALSYVWGGEQPNCTVTTNLRTYIEGIDIDLIPQTIW
ncbi:hypothetical protein MPER_06140 [Moniliophthora perniciosa FA553]|nr:hypothetical protein MPER_06140 [Moniliophthora perniciosa FA553]